MATQTDKKRIILVTNPQRSRADQVARQLLEWLTPRYQIVAESLSGPLDLTALPLADFIIVLGGDGTILSTVRALGTEQIPLIGVNIGKLGFLAEFSLEELQEQFHQIASQENPFTRRTMLNCRIIRPDRSDFVTTAVNEIVITAGPPFRMIEISLSIADEHLARCAGDGLVVATPTGSTAYNLSAGGPILASTVQAVVITPLAAHSLTFRPIVVNLDKPIVVRSRSIHWQSDPDVSDKSKINTAVVVIDGQDNTPLKSEDRVVITRAQQQFLLVQNPLRSQWQLLNTKLNWGTLPNYNGPDGPGAREGN